MRCILPILCLASSVLMAADSVPLYRAEYQAFYKGHRLGHAEFAVRHDEATGHYVFSSTTTPRGLVKLFVPGPATERSEFVALPTGLRPLSFSYDDGSRKSDADTTIEFDWDRGIATTTRKGMTQEVALMPGVLDRATLQVTLMMDMAAHRPTGPYRLVDGDTLDLQNYELDGTETVDTPAGSFATERYVRRREGSSRSTWIWAAPELSYLAVKIEQRRDGEARTAFVLEKVEGLGARQGVGVR